MGLTVTKSPSTVLRSPSPTERIIQKISIKGEGKDYQVTYIVMQLVMTSLADIEYLEKDLYHHSKLPSHT